ncbi:major histocompatibility complex class I-related gene protein-like [Oncorhynchus tshawytscha]|uniref:major histocompatibility complex class I-related gene protein-like n=1 Tax=Oncorhynchus tshawytscha TaxID=74940 RepID=UPI001C3DA568|nr:major histocompatibility complex class I-related gene protein-like [Oncorhynchus tshawytscha]
MISFCLLFLWIPITSADPHSLKYLYTAVSGDTDFPEFMVVGLLDDQQFVHFGSNTKTLVNDAEWMNKTEKYYRELYTEPLINQYEGFKNLITFAKKQFNQTQSKGVHTIQNLYGCEWNDETELQDYFHHYGYDGEDFISLDMKTVRWITSVQQADTIKQKWDDNSKDLHYLKWYFTKECIDTLKKYVNFASSVLKKIVPPSVSLLQKTPSSPVTCHATGFYPSGVMVSWQKDGQEQHEDVLHGEILPNGDGTFQKSAHLTIDSEKWENNNYTCVVEHKENIIAIRLNQSVIKTNSVKPLETVPIIIGVGVVAVILLVSFIIARFIMWNRKSTASDDGSNPSMTQQNQMQLEVSLSLIKQVMYCIYKGPVASSGLYSY